MNKRIKEIALKADDYCRDYVPNWTMNDYNKKFAELIIGHATECVRDVLREEDSPLTYEATNMVQKRIKQYFGVKE